MKLLDLAALNHFTVSIAMLLFSRDRWARSLRSTPPLGKPSVLASFDYFRPVLLKPITVSLRGTEPIVDAKNAWTFSPSVAQLPRMSQCISI